MRALHHAAICTSDVEAALRFWCDGMGLTQMFDIDFAGDWRTLFNADENSLRSIFLGDADHTQAGLVELVVFDGVRPAAEADAGGPRNGFFLLSFERDVEPTLTRLSELGFTDGIRRVTVPVSGASPVSMAVITAPDGVVVELIGVEAIDTSTLSGT